MYRSEERVYVNVDRSKVVPEDSPEAAFLLVNAGGNIEDSEARRLGLTGKKASDQPAELEPEAGAETQGVAPEPSTEEAEAEPDRQTKTTEPSPRTRASREGPNVPVREGRSDGG